MAKNLSAGAASVPAPEPPDNGKRALRPLKIVGDDRAPVAAFSSVLPEDQHAGIVLIYKPGRIEVYGDRVLPDLVHAPLENGVGGVTQRRDGSFNISGLRENEEQNGAFLLPFSWGYVGEGQGPANRLGVVPCDLAWSNQSEYLALVASWVDEGRLPAPSVDDLDRLLARKQRDLDLLYAHQKNPETATFGAAELRRQIAVVELALVAARGA